MHEDRVVIAGAGPVGLTLALALRRKGIPVMVVEAQTTYCQEFRAPAFHSPTLDMLDELGLLKPMKDIGLVVPTMRFADRSLGRAAELDMGILKARGVTENPFDLILGQMAFARIGYEACVAAGVAFLFNHRVADVGQDDRSAWLVCDTSDGEVQIAGRYMIGCDGGRSVVRKSLPVTFEGFTWPERFLMIHVLEDFEPYFGKVQFLANGPDWRLVLKIPFGAGPNDWVSRMISALPPEIDEQAVASPEFLQSRFDGLIEGRTEPYPIRDHYIYNVHQRVASQFRVGRILLAGDAAHINNPLGGLGLNCGIHDAVNLADKLDRIWRSEGDERLLDLYDRQRRITNAEFIQKVSIENKQRQETIDLSLRSGAMDALQAMQTNDDMRFGFLRRWTMIDSLNFAGAID
jgi:3-(3-hydroxy-phenyl)propionate hydroxylase